MGWGAREEGRGVVLVSYQAAAGKLFHPPIH